MLRIFTSTALFKSSRDGATLLIRAGDIVETHATILWGCASYRDGSRLSYQLWGENRCPKPVEGVVGNLEFSVDEVVELKAFFARTLSIAFIEASLCVCAEHCSSAFYSFF